MIGTLNQILTGNDNLAGKYALIKMLNIMLNLSYVIQVIQSIDVIQVSLSLTLNKRNFYFLSLYSLHLVPQS